MKTALYYLAVELIVCLTIIMLSGQGFNKDSFTELGLANLILGVLGLIVGTVLTIANENKISKPLVISSALLLLIGLVTCSAFPFTLNG